jgi:3-dehydroquinate synthase
MQNITVDLGSRSYPILVGRETLSSFGEVCRTFAIPQRVVIVTDSNVARLYLPQLSNALKHVGYHVESVVIPHGEKQKTFRRANALITKLINLGVGRQSALIALGGGVVGDITGFVAATYRRGVTFIQCPTTLLSQVDSSIGGKVGVNHPLAKNAVGSFYQPRFVFTDINLLRTLPKREVISGLGEIVKYGLIEGGDMFAFLETHVQDILSLDLDVVQETAMRCIAAKARLVSEDEREEKTDGGRAVLNIGHAVGQTLEALLQYRLRHGEAVLWGLQIESDIARELGLMSASDHKVVQDYLNLVPHDRFPMVYRHGGAPLFSQNKLVRYLMNARFVLPAGIGKVVFRQGVPEEVIRKSVARLVAKND